jgi:hypothetical protein
MVLEFFVTENCSDSKAAKYGTMGLPRTGGTEILGAIIFSLLGVVMVYLYSKSQKRKTLGCRND